MDSTTWTERAISTIRAEESADVARFGEGVTLRSTIARMYLERRRFRGTPDDWNGDDAYIAAAKRILGLPEHKRLPRREEM